MTSISETPTSIGQGVPPSWIAVDWGSSRFRAWAMGNNDTILDHRETEDGCGGLEAKMFEEKLLGAIGPWLSDGVVTPVVVCGMAGSRQGWCEAPYAPLPAAPSNTGSVSPATSDPRIKVHILGGVCQSEPADVMRGEETQIAGLLARTGLRSALICLPGTHSKWAVINDGVITGTATAMTGELFALLSTSSVLRHSVGTTHWDADAFREGVALGLDAPSALAAHLFAIRAEDLLHGLAPQAARARLSGLLIGHEIAAQRDRLGVDPVYLVGAPALTALYTTALEMAGVDSVQEDGDGLTLKGLIAAYTQRDTKKDHP